MGETHTRLVNNPERGVQSFRLFQCTNCGKIEAVKLSDFTTD